MSRKLFVGSLPNGITGETLTAQFAQYGQVEDIFVKPGCEPGRQWGFVTMATPEAAQLAKDSTDRVLLFPGSERPCDVMFAKNNDPIPGGQIVVSTGSDGLAQPKKVFVGSLPGTITDADLRAEFSKYGTVTDIHINTKPVEPGRQWAFIAFVSSEMAQIAKISTDRQLVFPGSEKAAEVALARHQGMYGQDSLSTDVHGLPVVAAQTTTSGQGAKKIFVGSIPQGITMEMVTAEFSRYGQVLNVHLNEKPVEPGRNWAFVTYAAPEQANYARDATNKILIWPGSDKACEVMIAKNQGKNGQEPLTSTAAPIQGFATQAALTTMVQPQQQQFTIASAIPMGNPGAAPPPPSVPPPPSLTPWRMYKTSAGLPYYHNHATGQTQWECPTDLQGPGQGAYGQGTYGAIPVAAVHHIPHYLPY